jgi:hypothetical protein
MSRVLTHEEGEIWRAAYAAAFVADFERSYQISGGAFDRVANRTSAERAITIADLAVTRLAQWRKDEQPLAGVELAPLPKEWDEL